MIREILTIMNYVDGVADTPFHDADNPILITEYTFTSARMGSVTLTATLMYPECLDNEWNGRQYVEFHGEKYFVNGTPSSSKDNEDARFRHELSFMSERDIKLNNVYFYDAVSDASAGDDKYKSNSTKVVFFGTINEFAVRLGESLKYSGIDYTVVVDDGITSEPKLISFEDQFFFNVLQEIYDIYKIPFYFVGKTIHIGFAANAITHTFRYGIENELLSIKKNNANFRIVNRCTGTGSEDNIPFYYPNLTAKGDISAKANEANKGILQKDIEIVDRTVFSDKMDFVTPLRYIGNITASNTAYYYTLISQTVNRVSRVSEISKSAESRSPGSGIGSSVPNDRYYPSREPSRPQNKEYEIYSPGSKLELKFGLTSDDWKKNIYLKISSDISNPGYIKFAIPISYSWKSGEYYANVQIDKYIDTSKSPENCSVTQNADGDFIIKADSAGQITFFMAISVSITLGAWAGGNFSYEYAALYEFSINPTFETYGVWEHGKESITDLSDIGLSTGGAEPLYGDEIYMVLDRYITPSQKLLPSVYRETYGAQRFYNAENGKYTNPDTETMYVFENEFVPTAPKEHIEDFPDIKPTIEGITNASGQRFDTILGVAFDNDDNDELDEENNYRHPYFFVKLPKFNGDYGFNLFDHTIDEGKMSLSMKSGQCGACEFTIGVSDDYRQANLVQVDGSGNLLRDEDGNVRCGRKGMPEESPQDRQNDTENYEVWIALKKEDSTYGQIMPNRDQNLKVAKGDTFVILHIDMPQAYIENAEKRLEEAIIKYMADNNSEKFNFSIEFSRIFLAENPDIASQLNENASIQIEYNKRLTELYITQYTYKCIDGEALPEVQVELNETVTVNKTTLQNTADAIAMDVQNGIANIDFLTQGLRYFLRKDTDDESTGKPRFLRGAEFGKYASGILGSGGAFSIDESNRSHIEVDYLTVRRRADFTRISVEELKSIGGQLIVSPAAMVCSTVEDIGDAYRCYFDTGGEGVEAAVYNQFVIGDQARMQNFNEYQIAYYWRLVVNVGQNYIDLSKTDCDNGSDIPMPGDNIVQLGNRNDPTRQSAQILSCHGENAPSFVMYNGIDSYDLTGKNIMGISYNPEKKEPQFYCYGSAFIGDRNLDDPDATYMTFQQKEGESRKRLFINADMYIGKNSTGLTNLSEWSDKQQQINDAQNSANNAQATANEALEAAKDARDYIDNTLPEEIAEINRKLDGVVENWFYKYTPSRQNEPAATWIADGEEADHAGDTFTNIQEYVDDETTPDAGKSWRWALIDGQYNWTPIADSDAVKALQQAAKAQDTADQKRRTFVTTPYTPYDVGDLWTQGASGDIMRCIKARATGNYAASDWDKASKYTDDAVAQDALAKADAAQDAADAAQDAADAAQAAASKAQSTADNAVADASDANKQLANLMSDNVITPPEKTALKQQHSDIKAEYTQTIADAQKYGVSTTTYTNAYNAANTALTKYTAASPENITVDSDYSNISAYYAARQTILNTIAAAAKKVADAAQDAADAAQDAADAAQDTADQAAASASQALKDAAAAQSAIQEVRGDLTGLNDAVSDLDEYVDGAFRDGVINDAESIAIKKYLNTVNESWADLQASYNVVYNNSSLTGTPKTNLKNAYNTLSTRKTNLINAINTAVSNPSSANITAVDTAFTNYNSAVRTFKNALENANKSIQDGIRDDVSDLDYLKNTFGYVVDVNGVVLGKLVAVKDEDGNVKAMLNGSDLGKDNTHGKLLLATGMDNIQNPTGAKTKIYEDGYIHSQSARIEGLISAQSGRFGAFWTNTSNGFGSLAEISSSGQKIGDTEIMMNPEFAYFRTSRNDGNEDSEISASVSRIWRKVAGTTFNLDGDVLYSYASPQMYAGFSISVRTNKNDFNGREVAALRLSAVSGNGKAYAVLCETGMFAGLRPKVRTVGSNTELTEFDHTILIDASASIRINLPANPLIGQTYDLLMNNAPSVPFNHRIICNRNIIHYGQSDIWSASEVEIDAYGAVRMTFAEDINGNGRWWVYRIAV